MIYERKNDYDYDLIAKHKMIVKYIVKSLSLSLSLSLSIIIT